MSAIRPDSRDLLVYNERYGVLICRECQYAIQKSALQSHLLRHKIYRGERQRLLSSFAHLELFEPQNVPLPISTSRPIHALPIISGYRCTAPGCGNLCASSKRMRRHWSEIHGLNELLPKSSLFARPVTLQTFFRGTKLRYFEVASPPMTDATAAVPQVSTTNDDDENDDERGHDGDIATSSLRVPISISMPPRSVSADLDLETLTYFHHFTTTTSLTLPSTEHPPPATHYWQTEVVLQALQRRWLMCGLLTLSACHLAALAEDTTIKRVHLQRVAQFFVEFSAGWDQITKRDMAVAATAAEEEAKTAGGQMRCILRWAHCALTESTSEKGIIPESATSFQIVSIMGTVRSFIVSDLPPRPGGVRTHEHERQEEPFAQATRILNMRSSSDAGSSGIGYPSNNTPFALLNHLRELPFHMAEAFGKPENARDVLATLSAIAALVECCDTSFASNEVEAGWQGMATWLAKVSHHFNHMVSRQSPAAYVVLAHWAALLVKRAEHCGCWFLKGSAKMILRQIAERLPANDLAVQSLVRSLMA